MHRALRGAGIGIALSSLALLVGCGSAAKPPERPHPPAPAAAFAVPSWEIGEAPAPPKNVAVSTGKSCEGAVDENPQRVHFGRKARGTDLTKDELSAPVRTSAFFSRCNLPDTSRADICVAVQNGKALGVSVTVEPRDDGVAACIDRAARTLHFPKSEALDVVHGRFD